MTEDKRVMVAMSGGVDSSVAAAMLLDRGYHVEGMTMRLWHEGPLADEEGPSQRAKSVCRLLGITHHDIDLSDAFYEQVVCYFVQEYSRGRTPNPCLRCNRLFKFGTLLRSARELGCQTLATGHYARVTHSEGGWHLLCGADSRKDQSYVLYSLGQDQLGAVLFPLGELTKAQVRERARAWGLPVAEQAESQDICFLKDRDYRRFVIEHLEEIKQAGATYAMMDGATQPGPIYDKQHHLLGRHRGLAFYTVGQREGLGIAASRPYYVLSLDSAHNAVIVGHAEELGRATLVAEEMLYVSGAAVPAGHPVEAKIRYRAQRVPAHVWPAPGAQARIVFERPLRDITPGQAVVLYDGLEVLGGGIISEHTDENSTEIDPTHVTS